MKCLKFVINALKSVRKILVDHISLYHEII